MKDLEAVYGPTGRSIISTVGRGPLEVAREIARAIFLDDYQTVDIEEELRRVCKRKR